MSTLTAPLPVVPMQPNDLKSDQEVRWCPGCGDYSILAQMRRALAPLGVARENMVFISGIGCSSRFPYYMNAYGFHTIHGRAPTFATGLKVSRPELQVWVITGDGDGLSIGGNHLLHVLRRNVDLKIVLFNNEIYGLTKGQYSPTSRSGTKSKSTPTGSFEHPLRPLTMAVSSGATFIARTTDVDIKHLSDVLQRAAAHKGAAFIEVYQNCKIFNDAVFEYATDKSIKSDNTIMLEHGKPLIYGKDRDKGIRLNRETFTLEKVTIGRDVSVEDLLVHNENVPDPNLAFMLSNLVGPEFPEVMGVLRSVQQPTYDAQNNDQIAEITRKKGAGKLEKLFASDDMWVVKPEEGKK